MAICPLKFFGEEFRPEIYFIPSSASLFVFQFRPRMAKYAYFKEPFLTHLISLKRVQGTRRIRIFCARNNMRAFLPERHVCYNLSSKMTISHFRLAGTKIFQSMNMPEIFKMSSLTFKKKCAESE